MSDTEDIGISEWDNVICLPIIDISQTYKEEELSSHELKFITQKQLNDYIFGAEINHQLPYINTETKSTNFLKLLRHLFCCGFGVKASLKAERDRIFAIAIQPLDNHDKFHCQCLYTIYSKLTGNVINGYRRFGHHWEEIGFQGTDPTTDFRGVGILGLFQLTFFVVSPETSKLCKDIYDLSLDGVQHFPFAIMSMNITQISLQVLREGLLNKMINQNESVLKVFNQFYFGTFLTFYKIWIEQQKTIVDTGYVLKDLRIYVRQNIVSLVNECFKQKAKRDDQNKLEEDFTNIGNI